MADIALVHLALDSSGVVAGEKQATRALQNGQSVQCSAAKKQAQQFGSALQGLGGPVGRVSGEISNLGGQIEALTGSFRAGRRRGCGCCCGSCGSRCGACEADT